MHLHLLKHLQTVRLVELPLPVVLMLLQEQLKNTIAVSVSSLNKFQEVVDAILTNLLRSMDVESSSIQLVKVGEESPGRWLKCKQWNFLPDSDHGFNGLNCK